MTPSVILLAAGKSTRTWPIREKIFFSILGKSILQHQIETLLSAGLYEICVVGNKENISRIQEICAPLPGKFSFAVQENLKEGQRGGILSAENFTSQEKPVCIVCSNDIVENNVFLNLLEKTKKSSTEICLVAKKVESYFPGGYLSVNDSGRIISIVEKPTPGTEPSNLVSLLIHFYRHPVNLFARLKKRKEGDFYEEILQEWFSDGGDAEVLEYSGFWQAIKYPWHFLVLREWFLKSIQQQEIHPSAQISKNAVVRGNVIISEEARIFDFAVIQGPAYIGKNTIVANHTLVRDSIIENNCVIGHTTEIARSIISDSCWTHRNFIGDSVFQKNVSLGAGTQTGNLRLDEKEVSSDIKGEKINSCLIKFGSIVGENVRIGINTSIMPGIKIGAESFLGAGGVCIQDIPENTFLSFTTSEIRKKNTFSVDTRKDF